MATIATATRERVLERHRAGDPASRIAHVLHLSPSTVHRALREAGVQREHKATVEARASRAEQAPMVRRLVEAGMTTTQICGELRMGHGTLKQIAEEHGIVLRQAKVGAPSRKVELMPKVRELVDHGKSQSEIAKELDLMLPTLSRWLKQEEIHLGRIDRSPARTSNLGATPEELSAMGRRGGQASAEALEDVACLYCGENFTRKRASSGRASRGVFCSKEHAYSFRRENSGKTSVYSCEYCSKEFSWWTNQPRRYCSREHFFKAGKSVPKYGFKGKILESGYEAAFVGMCSILGVPFKHFNREEQVEWKPGSSYGPDFTISVRGKVVHVDTKGRERGVYKWEAFREKQGLLAIIRRDDLLALMKVHSKKDWLDHIYGIALAQNTE